MRKGFTLIELAIVLVIIGLLVGGILVAGSLISSAKTTRLVKDIGQYETSVMLFQTQFGEYPGDSRLLTPAGDGNNVISMGIGACTGAYENSEMYNGWTHLSQAGMISTNYAPYSPGGSATPSPNCGGSHIYFSNESYAGVLWPYTEVSPEVASNFTGYRKSLIQTVKESNITNFGFILYTDPMDTLALEQKLGAQLYNNSIAQIGLTNSSGSGNCLDTFGAAVACSSANAIAGELFYFVQPQ